MISVNYASDNKNKIYLSKHQSGWAWENFVKRGKSCRKIQQLTRINYQFFFFDICGHCDRRQYTSVLTHAMSAYIREKIFVVVSGLSPKFLARFSTFKKVLTLSSKFSHAHQNFLMPNRPNIYLIIKLYETFLSILFLYFRFALITQKRIYFKLFKERYCKSTPTIYLTKAKA